MPVKALIASLRDGAYAHGGYPKYWLTDDGETLSHAGVLDQLGRSARASRAAERGYDRADRDCAQFYTEYEHGWAIVGCDINWEDPDMQCAHTNERIPSAYAEDHAEGKCAPDCCYCAQG